MLNEISKRLNEEIKKSGLSHAELEKKSGVPRSAIQRYASGDTKKLPVDRVKALADALNVSPSYLMGWDDDIDQDYILSVAKNIEILANFDEKDPDAKDFTFNDIINHLEDLKENNKIVKILQKYDSVLEPVKNLENLENIYNNYYDIAILFNQDEKSRKILNSLIQINPKYSILTIEEAERAKSQLKEIESKYNTLQKQLSIKNKTIDWMINYIKETYQLNKRTATIKYLSDLNLPYIDKKSLKKLSNTELFSLYDIYNKISNSQPSEED